MSSRVAEKQRLREQREEREREEAWSARRKRRLGLLGAAAFVAVVAVAVAVMVSSSGGGTAGKGAKASDTNALFGGIPQRGVVLGSPKAPVTLEEFADLQCPVCKEYTLNALPTLVQRYVRSGKVRMVFRNISILGPDSAKAAQAGAAAALQGRLWQFADRFYHDQLEENSGYVNDAFIRRVAGQVPRLDPGRLMAERDSPAARRLLVTATDEARTRSVDGTPTFFLSRTGGPARELQPTALTPDQFSGPIENELASR
jgi:protein-disulfide isomerase